MINGAGPDFGDEDELPDYRDMPPGPERQAAKTETFRRLYSGEGDTVRITWPDDLAEFRLHGTITGRLSRIRQHER